MGMLRRLTRRQDDGTDDATADGISLEIIEARLGLNRPKSESASELAPSITASAVDAVAADGPSIAAPAEPRATARADSVVARDPEPTLATPAAPEPEPARELVASAAAAPDPEIETSATPDPEPTHLAAAVANAEPPIETSATPDPQPPIETSAAPEPEPTPLAAAVAEPQPPIETSAEPEPEPAQALVAAAVADAPIAAAVVSSARASDSVDAAVDDPAMAPEPGVTQEPEVALAPAGSPARHLSLVPPVAEPDGSAEEPDPIGAAASAEPPAARAEVPVAADVARSAEPDEPTTTEDPEPAGATIAAASAIPWTDGDEPAAPSAPEPPAVELTAAPPVGVTSAIVLGTRPSEFDARSTAPLPVRSWSVVAASPSVAASTAEELGIVEEVPMAEAPEEQHSAAPSPSDPAPVAPVTLTAAAPAAVIPARVPAPIPAAPTPVAPRPPASKTVVSTPIAPAPSWTMPPPSTSMSAIGNVAIPVPIAATVPDPAIVPLSPTAPIAGPSRFPVRAAALVGGALLLVVAVTLGLQLDRFRVQEGVLGATGRPGAGIVPDSGPTPVPTGMPALQRSALAQAILVDRRLLDARAELAAALKASPFDPIDVARILRTISADSVYGAELTEVVAGWPPSDSIADDLRTLYDSIHAVASDSLIPSIRYVTPYRRAAATMVALLAGVQPVDDRAGALARAQDDLASAAPDGSAAPSGDVPARASAQPSGQPAAFPSAAP